jgi:IPT/TIG domain
MYVDHRCNRKPWCLVSLTNAARNSHYPKDDARQVKRDAQRHDSTYTFPLTSLSPNTGSIAGGTEILIAGFAFGAATRVQFGLATLAGTDIVVINDSTISGQDAGFGSCDSSRRLGSDPVGRIELAFVLIRRHSPHWLYDQGAHKQLH